MISRHWRGVARPGEAERYITHLEGDTFPGLSRIPGFVSASILRREVDAGTEFEVITVWESWQAIRAFAGETAETAVVPPLVQAMMVDYDRHVVHYEIARTYAPVMPRPVQG